MRIPQVVKFTVVLLAILCAGSAPGALAAPSAMTYQGQLRTTTGTPVADGMYSVTFTLWTAPVAGSMIWTETQSVHVEGGNGLFSCELGNLQPLGGPIMIHNDGDLYLQTAVAGQTLTPRQRLGAAAYAHYTGTVKSDVDGVGSMDMSLGEDTTKIHVTHESFTNLLDSYVHLTDDNVTEYRRCFGAGQPHPQSCNADNVSEDEARTSWYVDGDADGIAEGQGEMRITGGTPGSVVFKGTWDVDDNGVADFTGGGEVNDSSSQWGVSLDKADVAGNHRDGWNVICVDGLVRSDIKVKFENGDIPDAQDFVDSRGAFSRAINTKGTGAIVRTSMEATDSGAVVVESDSDGDGIAEAHGIMTCKPGTGGSGGTSKGRFSNDPNEDGQDECLAEAGVGDKFAQVRGFQVDITGARRSSFGFYADSAGAVASVGHDKDGDGHNVCAAEAKGDDKFAQVRGFKVDIAGARRSSFSNLADSAGSVMSIDLDSDNDGVEDVTVGGSVNDSAAEWSVTSVDEGNHRDGWNVLHVDGLKTRTELKQEFQNGDIPSEEDFVDSRGAFSRAINTTGTGATVRVASEATDSASGEYGADSDGDGTMESKANIAAVLNGNVVIECVRDTDDDGTPDVSAETEVSSDSATIRLTATTPGGPGLPPGSSAITMGAGSSGVHMEVGAATCDGTNWTNASDRNLKENFAEVDGEELLDKVSELPITQWNYKGDADNKHIGPTAQDFKSTFGVGSDGKSISTIDPSGVALAAIQQLIKENEELRVRMAKLEAELAKQAR